MDWEWVGEEKRGILNNRKETLMATKHSFEALCLKFRHIVQYPNL